MSDVKPLSVSANRWTPRSLESAKDPAAAAPGSGPPGATVSADGLMSPEMVQRKVKAALNKMTPEKFDKISEQILEITGQSKHESDGRTLRQVIQLTFEKATDEAHWASMYAKFCKRMLETIDPSIRDKNIKDKNGVTVTGGNLFRKYLLNRCQEEFERGWKVNLPDQTKVTMWSDEYYIAAAAKRRGLGLVQFIGELFKLGMLTERIMNECARKLLDFEGLPEDETVESLSKLLRTIGGQLDLSEKSRPIMDVYFDRIVAMIENKELSIRMRFMLMDIVDLRKRRWESSEKEEIPKTIQEVREEALKAQQQEEEEAISKANGNKSSMHTSDIHTADFWGVARAPDDMMVVDLGSTIPDESSKGSEGAEVEAMPEQAFEMEQMRREDYVNSIQGLPPREQIGQMAGVLFDLDKGMSGINKRMDRLETKLDGFEKRMGAVEKMFKMVLDEIRAQRNDKALLDDGDGGGGD